MDTVSVIEKILLKYGLQDLGDGREIIPILENAKKYIVKNQKMTFVLPAFPAKSPSPEKTHGQNPDYGEVLALKNLENLCLEIEAHYPQGAEIIICSDGRAFSDLVNVTDSVIDLYNEGIAEIIRDYNLSHLSLFRMDDLYMDLNPQELRGLLISQYAENLEEVKEKIKIDVNYNKLFCGIHKFLFEDEVVIKNISKNQASKVTKEKAYELIQRSEAWSKLLDNHFKDALRLSIHPHALSHEKFGICLVPSSSKWATPWHNVVVKVKDRFELMHKKEAMKLNAVIKMEFEKYAYFEIPAI